MNDDAIIKQRIDGRSVRAIARARRTTVSEINKVIDGWAWSTIDDRIRKHTLALERDEIRTTGDGKVAAREVERFIAIAERRAAQAESPRATLSFKP